MPNQSQTTLRHVRFSAAAEVRLQAIMDRLGTNDVARILRSALCLYEWAIEEIEAGKAIVAIDKDGKAQSINVHEQP